MRKIKLGKWGKRVIVILIVSISFLSLYGIGYLIYNDMYLPKRCESLYENGMKNVEQADSVAMVLIDGTHYRYFDKALKILENSAEKGNIHSMVLLGRYYKGYDIKHGYDERWGSDDAHDFDKSSYWYLRAAKKGNSEAQGEIGHNYKYGFGVEQNFDKAIYWTKQGADNGDAVAQWRMGNIYANGLAYYLGDFTDYQVWWYNGGDVFVAKNAPNVKLDREYVEDMKNRGPEKVFLSPDIKKAKRYWLLSANQGFRQAKDALEKVYEGDD